LKTSKSKLFRFRLLHLFMSLLGRLMGREKCILVIHFCYAL
jgi:hypothetical protein